MKIQKTYKAGLFALMMLFVLPTSLMAADGKWDRMLDALHHNRAAVSHLSKQDRAILEVTIQLKAHRLEQAMSILEDLSEDPLIKQLKVQAGREHLLEVVRRAGGTRSEMNLPAPSEELNKALAEVDARLNTFMQSLQPATSEQTVEQVVAQYKHPAAPTYSAVQDISPTFLEQMTPAKRWTYLLNELQHNKFRVSKHLSKQDKAVLMTAVLLKAGQPAQALKVLDAQPSNDLTKYLKTKATQERIIKAVIRAGGSRREVHLPAASTAMADALASLDARLQAFMHQLNQEKAKPVRVALHSIQVAKKAAVSPRTSNQNIKPATVVEQLADKPQTDAVVDEQPMAEKHASEVRRGAAAPRVLVAKAIPSGVTDEAANAAVNAGQPVSPQVHDAVLQTVEAWRVAWSNQDLDAYFSAYADDYDVTDRFASMHEWKTYKRWVIGKRSAIQVRLELIKVSSYSADQVRVEFLQHFRADSYQSDDLKSLTWKRSGDGWKIIREESMNSRIKKLTGRVGVTM